MVVLEWVRGWLFSGFGWLNLGASQVPASPLAGYAPYIGAYGVSLAVAAAAALLVALGSSRAWSRDRAWLLAGVVALFVAGAAGKAIEWTQPSGAPIAI